MESFGDYVRAGINMGIGTDTTPHNMLEEIRKAGTLARVASRDINNVSTGMLFHAATVGGAKALMRDDIGRLAMGAKADIVLVDLHHPDMMPARDPLRSLVFHAADRAVKDVYVGGRKIVADGKVTTLDHKAAGERLTEMQKSMMASSPGRDYLEAHGGRVGAAQPAGPAVAEGPVRTVLWPWRPASGRTRASSPGAVCDRPAPGCDLRRPGSAGRSRPGPRRVKRTSSAFTFWVRCSGLSAPAMIVDMAGRDNSQASDICGNVQLRSCAKAVSFSCTSQLRLLVPCRVVGAGGGAACRVGRPHPAGRRR